MTHRLYKEEYNAEFINQIIVGRINGLTATGEETEKVVIIEGEAAALRKLASLMYAEPAEIKAVFPQFMTAEEYAFSWESAYCKAFEAFRNEMVIAARKTHGTGYDITNIEHEMHNLFVDMKIRVNEICNK